MTGIDDFAQVFDGLGEPLVVIYLELNTGMEKSGEHLFHIFQMNARVLGKFMISRR